MYHPTKIAKCCYCGTRAALVLKGKERHELCCSACGAPLHDLKMMPVRHDVSRRDRMRGSARPNPAKPAREKPKSRRGKPKPRRGLRHFLGETFDLVEDIFD